MKQVNEPAITRFSRVNYAHRGLYTKDQSIPENSLAAFRRAVEKGYGIELDVQVSRDGQVMVFHDDNLKRMCGVDGYIWDYSCDELMDFRLKNTNERIPLFTEVLEILEKGSGPLLCELKTGPRNDELCEKTLSLLESYRIDYCIESFNPMIVNWFRKNAPNVFRGQLVTAEEKYDKYPAPLRSFLAKAGFSFLNQPDFIAFNREVEIPKAIRKLLGKGAILMLWTSHDESDQQNADAVIFEHYEPKPRY